MSSRNNKNKYIIVGDCIYASRKGEKMKKIIFILIGLILAFFACSKANDPFSDDTMQEIMRYNTVGFPVSIDISEDYVFVAENATGVSYFNRGTGALYQRLFDTYYTGPVNVPLRSTFLVKYIPEKNYLFIGNNVTNETISTRLYGFLIHDPTEEKKLIYNTLIQTVINDILYEINPEDDSLLAIWNSFSTILKMRKFMVNVEPGPTDDVLEEIYVTSEEMPLPTNSLLAINDYIIASMGQWGVYIIQKDDFSHVSTTTTPGDAQDVKIKGDFLYVADRHQGLQVIDASDITNPVLIKDAARATSGYATTIDISGNLLALSSNSGGVYLYDITEGDNPKLITRNRNLGYVYQVKFFEDELYVASREYGVIRFQINI